MRLEQIYRQKIQKSDELVSSLYHVSPPCTACGSKLCNVYYALAKREELPEGYRNQLEITQAMLCSENQMYAASDGPSPSTPPAPDADSSPA